MVIILFLSCLKSEVLAAIKTNFQESYHEYEKFSSLKSYLRKKGKSKNKIPNCRPTKNNLCISKGAGGHTTIFSTVDGFCAKKISTFNKIKEIEFYEDMESICRKNRQEFDDFCSFIPQFGGLCAHEKGLYTKIDNLKLNSVLKKPMKEPWALDLKLGTHTASATSMKRHQLPSSFIDIPIWKFIHFLQDRYLTSSQKEGYRFAGLSKNQGVHERAYSRRERLTFLSAPQTVIHRFLDQSKMPKTSQCFYDKLLRLKQAFSKDSIEHLHLVGSSLLFVYDHNSADLNYACQLNLIDFANSFYAKDIDKHFARKNQKYLKGIRKGIKNLITAFRKN